MFNAVVEGTIDERVWGKLNYEITKLSIPFNVRNFSDGTYNYRMVDLANFDLTEVTETLGYSDGVSFKDDERKLLTPRAIFLKDGRVFVEEKMIGDKIYLDAVLRRVSKIKTLFDV